LNRSNGLNPRSTHVGARCRCCESSPVVEAYIEVQTSLMRYRKMKRRGHTIVKRGCLNMQREMSCFAVILMNAAATLLTVTLQQFVLMIFQFSRQVLWVGRKMGHNGQEKRQVRTRSGFSVLSVLFFPAARAVCVRGAAACLFFSVVCCRIFGFKCVEFFGFSAVFLFWFFSSSFWFFLIKLVKVNKFQRWE